MAKNTYPTDEISNATDDDIHTGIKIVEVVERTQKQA